MYMILCKSLYTLLLKDAKTKLLSQTPICPSASPSYLCSSPLFRCSSSRPYRFFQGCQAYLRIHTAGSGTSSASTLQVLKVESLACAKLWTICLRRGAAVLHRKRSAHMMSSVANVTSQRTPNPGRLWKCQCTKLKSLSASQCCGFWHPSLVDFCVVTSALFIKIPMYQTWDPQFAFKSCKTTVGRGYDKCKHRQWPPLPALSHFSNCFGITIL